MTVEYDVYKTPKGFGEEKEAYHVRVKNKETVTTDQIAAQIEHDTVLTKGDVKNVLMSLSHHLVKCLGEGKRLHIEGIGYFSLLIEAPAVASPKDMRAEYVQVKGIAYRPDKRVKVKLADTKFKRAKVKEHSGMMSDEMVRDRLTAYFVDHAYLRRKDFENLCGFTTMTAIRRLNALLADGLLKKDGERQSAVYLLNEKEKGME